MWVNYCFRVEYGFSVDDFVSSVDDFVNVCVAEECGWMILCVV